MTAALLGGPRSAQAEKLGDLNLRLAGTYASRYGLYNYRRPWYAMPYRSASYLYRPWYTYAPSYYARRNYYRPWYTFPPSTFVTPKNYSYYLAPGWDLPWPYPRDLALPPVDPWGLAPEEDCFDPPVDEIFEPVSPAPYGGRYYW